MAEPVELDAAAVVEPAIAEEVAPLIAELAASTAGEVVLPAIAEATPTPAASTVVPENVQATVAPTRPTATALEPARREVSQDPLAVIRDDVDTQVLPIFLEEAAELYPQAGERVRAWRRAPGDDTRARQLRRTLHTFKGSARMAGAMRLGELVHLDGIAPRYRRCARARLGGAVRGAGR